MLIHVVSCSSIYTFHVCDNNRQYDPEYDEVLHSINLVINQHSDVDHIVIGGDQNTDMPRVRSSHTTALQDFCVSESLTMCINHAVANIDYTYESAMGLRHILDNFIVFDNLLQHMMSFTMVIICLAMMPCDCL